MSNNDIHVLKQTLIFMRNVFINKAHKIHYLSVFIEKVISQNVDIFFMAKQTP